MKKRQFIEKKIVFVLNRGDLGTYMPNVCRKLGMSDVMFYILHKKYGVMSLSGLKHMRQLEAENPRLKRGCRSEPQQCDATRYAGKKELTLVRLSK